MIIEYITFIIYLIMLSFLIVFVVGRLGGIGLKTSTGLEGVFVQNFLKGYIKQGKKQKIFLFRFLKYPLFLSTPFLILQLQLLDLGQPQKGMFLMIPLGMIFYVFFKTLYVDSVGEEDKKYFKFIATLDSFFFDLLLIMVIFSFARETQMWIKGALFIFLIWNVFFKIASIKRIKDQEGWFLSERGEVLDQVVFEFGERVYIIAILFFTTSTLVVDQFFLGKEDVMFSLNYHFKVTLSMALMVVLVNSIEWILQWPLQKKPLEQQIIRVKYILVPTLILILGAQLWRANGL